MIPEDGMVKTSPLIDYVQTLTFHDREMLLHILEVAEKAIIMDCTEKSLFKGLTLALWKSIKVEEMK